MDNERILQILIKVPKEILIKCAEIILKKKESLIKPILVTKKQIKKEPIKMATGQTNVMLGHPYNPDKHASKVIGWWMSEKYDGVRAKWNGEEMESRTGLIYIIPDFLIEQLQSITDEEGNHMELDGELWGGIDTLAFMSGLARRHDNDSELWENVTYMVFDTPDNTLPFEERIKKIAAALKRAGSLANVKGVKHIKFDPEKIVKYPHKDEEVNMNIEDELIKVEEKGGEGLVLRKPKSSYEFRRSQNFLKVKSWSYKEAIVTGYSEGTGKYLGMVGALTVKSNEFGEEEDESEKTWVNFKVGSGLNDWQRYTGDVDGNWKSKEVQNKIDEARKKLIKPIDKENETYKTIVHTIKTAKGKERSDALHQLNTLFTQIPVIGDVITFRFKELTKDGNPSMPTFVGVRNYE